MSNTFAPSGFQSTSFVPGLGQNFGLTPGKVAYNASAIYRGDPVLLASGKIAVATVTGNGGAAIAGIAESFSWVSIAQARRVWQSFYPGNDSQGNADVDVLFQGSPESLFICQVGDAGAAGSGTNQAVQADIGSFFNFYTGTGNTYSGMSTFSLDYATKNATQGTLPFVLQKIIQAPATDPTSANNLVVVGIASLTKF